MNKWCTRCKWQYSDSLNCAYCEAEHTTKMPNGFAPITNADRIRHMSDEELAEWMWDFNEHFVKKSEIQDWLKSPVKE